MEPVYAQILNIYDRWKEKMALGGATGTAWCLVGRAGQRYALPASSVYLGRDGDCDVTLQSESVDLRHAVLKYEPHGDRFLIRDLGSMNGTYLNERRVGEETFMAVDSGDLLRLGYDPMTYHMEYADELQAMEPARPDSAATSSGEPVHWPARESATCVSGCPGCVAEQDLYIGEEAGDPGSVTSTPRHSYTPVSSHVTVHNGHVVAVAPPSGQHQQHQHRHLHHPPRWSETAAAPPGGYHPYAQEYEYVEYSSLDSSSLQDQDFVVSGSEGGNTPRRVLTPRGPLTYQGDGGHPQQEAGDGGAGVSVPVSVSLRYSSPSATPPRGYPIQSGRYEGDGGHPGGLTHPNPGEENPHHPRVQPPVSQSGYHHHPTGPTRVVRHIQYVPLPAHTLAARPHPHPQAHPHRHPHPLPLATQPRNLPSHIAGHYVTTTAPSGYEEVSYVHYPQPVIQRRYVPQQQQPQPLYKVMSGPPSQEGPPPGMASLATTTSTVTTTVASMSTMETSAVPSMATDGTPHSSWGEGERQAGEGVPHKEVGGDTLPVSHPTDEPVKLTVCGSTPHDADRVASNDTDSARVSDVIKPKKEETSQETPSAQSAPSHPPRPAFTPPAPVPRAIAMDIPFRDDPPEPKRLPRGGQGRDWHSGENGRGGHPKDRHSDDVDLKPTRDKVDSSHAADTSAGSTPAKTPGSTPGTMATGTPDSPALHRRDQRRSVSGTDPDLETVQKGTPLYGQPSWWGEAGADNYPYPHTATLTNKDKHTNGSDSDRSQAERPSSLSLDHPGDVEHMATSGGRDADNGAPGGDAKDRVGVYTPPERDPGPGPGRGDGGGSPGNVAAPSGMAFTVDLDGDSPDKEAAEAARATKNLSECLPPKLRRSFRERTAKVKEKQEERVREMEANGDTSPQRQRKADAMWGSGVARKHSLSPRRTGYLSDGHNSSNLSSDNEDFSFRSDTVTGRGKKLRETGRSATVGSSSGTERRSFVAGAGTRPPAAKSSRETRKTPTSESRKTPTSSVRRKTPTSDSRKTPTSSDSRKTPTSSDSRKGRKTPSSEKEKKRKGGTVTDSAFLINRMLSSQDSRLSPTAAPGLDGEDEDSTEFQLYREAKLYDQKMKSLGGVKPRASAGVPTVSATRKSLTTSSSGGGSLHQTSSKSRRERRGPAPADAEGGIPDNLSDTGTYTIEVEEPPVDPSRDSIDTLFGVTDSGDMDLRLHRPVVADESDPEDYSPNDDSDRTPEDQPDLEEDRLTPRGVVGEDGGEAPAAAHGGRPHHAGKDGDVGSSPWAGQWGSRGGIQADRHGLPPALAHSLDLDLRSSSSSTSTPTHKLPTTPGRKPRVGTGRRLPTPPIGKTGGGAGGSGPSTPRGGAKPPPLPGGGSGSGEDMDWDAGRADPPSPVESNSDSSRHRATVTFDSESGGRFTVSFDAPHRELPASGTKGELGGSGDERNEEDEECGGGVFSSARTAASMDTDALLQDTEAMIKAMTDQRQLQKRTVILAEGEFPPALSRSELFLPIKKTRDSDSDSSSGAVVERRRTIPTKGRGGAAAASDINNRNRLNKSRSLETAGPPPLPPTTTASTSGLRKPPTPRGVAGRERDVRRSRSRGDAPALSTSGTSAPVTRTAAKATNAYRRANSAAATSTGSRDLLSSESETASILSSSTDPSESSPRLARRSVGGKTPISQTKTNRAFALRRARTDNESDAQRSDGSTITARSSRSRPSSAGTAPDSSPKTSARSTSRSSSTARSRSTSRTRPTPRVDSGRSQRTDISLGQKIVDRSRQNVKEDPSGRKDADLQRKDGGRHSLRSTRSSVTPTKTVTSSSRGGGRTAADPLRPRSGGAGRASTGGGLMVTGHGTSSTSTSAAAASKHSGGSGGGNRSNPNSRSNSPRSQEFNAWQRRKQYDPRRAAAEAKTKRARSVTSTEDLRQGKTPSHSVSSVSSEESGNVDRSRDIIKLSAEIAKNLEALSRDEGDALLEFRTRLGSDGTNSAFKSVPKARSPSPVLPPTPPSPSTPESAKQTPSPGDVVNGNDRGGVGAQEGYLNGNRWNKSEERLTNLVRWKSNRQSANQYMSYDNIIVASIAHLSSKVRYQTDKLVDKLRDKGDMSRSPSPLEDLPDSSRESDIQGWNSANQDLTRILNDLRKTEHHLSAIDRGLSPEGSTARGSERDLQPRQVERIREKAGFRPIERPLVGKPWTMPARGSMDTERTETLSGDDYY